MSSSVVGEVMDESNCLQELLSRSVITKEQYDKLQAQKVEASDPKTGEGVWLEVAKIIREDAQNFQKLKDVLERYEAAMSPVLIMLEKHFVLLEKKGDIEEAEEKFAKLSIHKGEGQEEKAGAEEVTIGKITYYREMLLGQGNNGTKVFKGKYDKRDVAVKRLLADSNAFVEREVELLRKSDSHPCIIRYHWMENDTVYHYLAFELADCTLHDYVKDKSTFTYSEGEAIKLLMQAIDGLSHLHRIVGIVHRDIKPRNILLFSLEFVKAKLSDFGLCKKIPLERSSFSAHSGATGTIGWMAPEVYQNESGRLSKSMDIFSMGCVIHFALISGQHPFGSDLRRQANIQDNKPDLSKLSEIKNYTALDLVQSMISHDSHDRPTVTEVWCHCLFWSEEKQLQFFVEVSDYIYKDMTSPAVKALEDNASIVLEGNWKEHITSDLKSVLDKDKSYDGSLVSLIRFIRNKRAHYKELPEEVKKSVGCIPDEYVRYFTSRFPSLLIHTYKAMRICKDESNFEKYYN